MRVTKRLLLTLGAIVLAARVLAADPPQVILLIGWDGAQRAHVQEMIGRGELPNLVALSSEGALVDVDVTSGATDTKAGWTQILTGYKPDKTGVYSNGKFQPIPAGYSVFERLEEHFGPDNIVTMAIVGKKAHVDNDPEQKIPYDVFVRRQQQAQRVNQQQPGKPNLLGGRIVEENGQKFVVVPGRPWLNASQHMDLFRNGLGKTRVVATIAMWELERNRGKRCFFFIHFGQPDQAGHQFGENSQQYTDAIEDDDAWTGRIIQKLRDLGLYDKALVYVAVDHGFDEGARGHRYAPYVFVATNDTTFVRREGSREDIAATVLKRFGVDLGTLNPPLDGIPYDQPAPERKAPPTPPPPPGRGGQPKPQ